MNHPRGATAAVMAGIAAPGWHGAARAEAKLVRGGSDAMGRWRIDALTWRAFVDHEERLSGESDALCNELAARRNPDGAGVEIAIGRDGVLIGGDMHHLPRRGLPEVTNARLRRESAASLCIELALYYPGMLLHPGQEIGGSRFSGTRRLLEFVVLGGVTGFGVVLALYGIWQMATGRRNPRVIHAMIGVVCVVVAAGFLV